ncbi:hypothetical protein ONZ43_g627 [Nemania bipapillata]|uniref:Uncharacterized protein n=1 Tax=Nemania bipapillata TaxID=110536 RepID=A0ACC2J7Y5_9PEZI|nr:hypothetical protein ONZ43_g627 [Nemania bipapillata]
MNCACRTQSLKIFVQSLTEFRFVSPAIPRSIRVNRLGLPVTRHQVPAPYYGRLYSSDSAADSPKQKWLDNAIDLSVNQTEEGQPHTSTDTGADTITHDPIASIPSASTDDFNAAKLNGAVLECNPDSIQALIASLNQASLSEQEAPSRHPNVNWDAEAQPRPDPEEDVTSSQLKRRKIIKDDAKKKPHAKETQLSRKEQWQAQKAALKEKFPEGWRPRKRLSPDALEGIRALHSQFPEQYTTQVLADTFQVSPEAIRRILRSRWRPNAEEEIDRQERWFNRGKNIWSQKAALGTKPPRRWRREGIVREPHWNEKRGPRTEYPYVPLHKESKDEGPVEESVQRRLSSNLL